MTIIHQAQAWYSARQEHLSKLFLRTQIGSLDPNGPDGELGFGLEGSNVIANICIWNSGLIRVPAFNKTTGAHFILDDKVLAPDEDLGVLLDRYVEQVLSA
jgi:hypothetical protein